MQNRTNENGMTMAETTTPTLPRAYDEDYAGWVEDTAREIEDGRFCDLDRAALADEVRDLGRRERARIESALCLLILHLLKTEYQPEKRTRSWDASIRAQRNHTARFLAESSSLRPELPKLPCIAYEDARIAAANEAGMDIEVFPEECEWTVAEVMAEAK